MVGDMGGASRCVMPLLGGNIDMYEQEWIYIYFSQITKKHRQIILWFRPSLEQWTRRIHTYEQSIIYRKHFSSNAENHINMHQWLCAHTHTLRCNRLMPTAFNQEALVLLAG